MAASILVTDTDDIATFSSSVFGRLFGPPFVFLGCCCCDVDDDDDDDIVVVVVLFHRYVQYDSWFYPKDAKGGVLTWNATADVAPDGFQCVTVPLIKVD